MNTNEHSEATERRLKRIQKVARFFKWVSVAAFVFVISLAALAIVRPEMVKPAGSASHSFGGVTINSSIILDQFEPGVKWLYPILWIVLAVFYCRAIWFFYGLFKNLTNGIIFHRDNVWYIRNLGWWLVAYPFVRIGFDLSKLIWMTDGPGMIDLSGLPNQLIFGFFVIFVAWIMDEGRKIQEEQALTV